MEPLILVLIINNRAIITLFDAFFSVIIIYGQFSKKKTYNSQVKL